MGRSPCCEKVGLKKGPWTPEEDQKLLAYIEEHGHGSWRSLPTKAELRRCGKSCRLRWTNYLRPDIKRGKFSLQEEQTIIQLHALLGNRWSAIATHLPKRTDNEIKNYWNTHLKKRLTKMGIDPVTHKPKNGALVSVDGRSKSAVNLNHMAQWESARLEAEARLVLESKLRTGGPPPAPTRPPTSSSSSSSTPCLDVLSAWQRVWPKSAPIDLESPTSTLAFSEMGIAGETNAEQSQWKCFRKTCFLMETGYTVRTEASSSWLTESSAGGFASGFTATLLGEQQISAEVCGDEPDNAECGSCVDVEEARGEEDENKDYWNSILNLVDSSSPPPVF